MRIFCSERGASILFYSSTLLLSDCKGGGKLERCNRTWNFRTALTHWLLMTD
jgi:hypothetical protein